jgi:hypothetical protein
LSHTQFLWDIGDKCVGAIHESPVQENGGWAGRFVNRPYNFVADPMGNLGLTFKNLM